MRMGAEPQQEAPLKHSPPLVRFLNPATMKPGDIILCSGSGFLSGAIRWFDRGRFSHALLWLGPVLLAEADTDVGVRVFAFTRFPITDPSKYILLRHTDEALAAQAAMHAQNHAQRHYGFWGAALSKVRSHRGRQSKSKRLFCSQLVARSYSKAGAPLFNTHDHVITPNMLLRAKDLKPHSFDLIEAEQLFDRAGSISGIVRDLESLPHLDATKARAVTVKAVPILNAGGAPTPANLLDVFIGAEQLQGTSLQELNDLIVREINAGSLFLDDNATFKSLQDWLDKLIARARTHPMRKSTEEIVRKHFQTIVLGWRDAATRATTWSEYFEKASVLKNMSAGMQLRHLFAERGAAFKDLISRVERLLELRA